MGSTEKIMKEIDTLSEKLIKKEGWAERFFRFTPPPYEILQQMKAVFPPKQAKSEAQARVKPVVFSMINSSSPTLKPPEDMPLKNKRDTTPTFKK